MRFNTKFIFKDYQGKPLVENEVDESSGEKKVISKPLTFHSVMVTALNTRLQDEVLTAEQKTKIYGLSVKFYQSKDVDLTEHDMSFLKDRINKIFPDAIVYGIVSGLFDGTVNSVQAPENPPQTTPSQPQTEQPRQEPAKN